MNDYTDCEMKMRMNLFYARVSMEQPAEPEQKFAFRLFSDARPILEVQTEPEYKFFFRGEPVSGTGLVKILETAFVPFQQTIRAPQPFFFNTASDFRCAIDPVHPDFMIAWSVNTRKVALYKKSQDPNLWKRVRPLEEVNLKQ